MSKWISVNDRLPINNTYELSGRKYEEIEVLVWDGIQVRKSYFAAGNTISFWSSFEAMNVTHWQPLPEPPIT